MTSVSTSNRELSVLVIDDDEEIRASLSKTLEQLKQRVVLAGDTAAGLDCFSFRMP